MRLIWIAAGLVSLAGCQAMPASPQADVGSAGTQTAQTSQWPTSSDWRVIQLGDCCEISVPSSAVDESGGQLIDSQAGARYRVGNVLITADLRGLPGLALNGPRQETERDVSQLGIDGYQNRTTIIVDRGPPGRQLSVNVICQERNCPLADRVLASVRVR